MLCLHRINRLNRLCYGVTFAAVLAGLAVGLGGFIDVGVGLVAVGAILIFSLTMETYLILPFVKCPRCHRAFFRRDGLSGNRVPLLNRSCLHCHLNIRTLDPMSGDPQAHEQPDS